MEKVLGYVLSECPPEVDYVLDEVLFAVTKEGKVFSTTRKHSSSFYQAKDKWVEVAKLPIEVEYIGKYKLNKGGC